MTAAASYTGWNSGSSRMAAALPHGALILSRETGFTMWSSLILPPQAEGAFFVCPGNSAGVCGEPIL